MIKQTPDLRYACEEAIAALESCYDVSDYPADGNTPQDAAIKLLRAALEKAEDK